MDDIEEVTYSQGEPYQPHDRSWESDDDTEHDKRLHSQTDAKYKNYEQEHLNRSRRVKNNSRCLVYLFTSTTSHFGWHWRSCLFWRQTLSFSNTADRNTDYEFTDKYEDKFFPEALTFFKELETKYYI